MTSYFKPIVRTSSPRSKNSIFLAETKYWISEAEEIKFGETKKLISIKDNVENYPNDLFKKNANIGKIYNSIISQFTTKRGDFDIYDREHFDYLVNDVLYPYGESNNILSVIPNKLL